MKAEMISDALNYLDEDLIAACDKARNAKKAGNAATVQAIPKADISKQVEKIESRRAPSRARVVQIWGSIAAAAVVLIIGGIVVFNLSGSKSAGTDSFTKSPNTLDVTTTISGSYSSSEAAAEDSFYEDVDDSGRGTDVLVVPDADVEELPGTSAENTVAVPIGNYVVYDGKTYIVDTDMVLNAGPDGVVGELLGNAEEGTVDNYADAPIYEYKLDPEEYIVVYDEATDAYYLASDSVLTL